MIPTLAGVHHVKLPVRELDRSIDWYASRLGYHVVLEFRDHGMRTGTLMSHPNGGPPFGLRLDPERARASAGFDYFAIGVPDRASLESLAAHLTALGESHAGVHFATVGWILPLLHDPDGHEVRFYSVEAHTALDHGQPLMVEDAVASARAKEKEWLAERAGSPDEGARSARESITTVK